MDVKELALINIDTQWTTESWNRGFLSLDLSLTELVCEAMLGTVFVAGPVEIKQGVMILN